MISVERLESKSPNGCPHRRFGATIIGSGSGVTKDSFDRFGANLAQRKDECDGDVQIEPDHWAEPRYPCSVGAKPAVGFRDDPRSEP